MADKLLIRTVLVGLLLSFMISAVASPMKKKSSGSVITWSQGAPGCTFVRGDDGRYRYSMDVADATIILAVDSQELQKIRRRPIPIFGVFLIVHYTGENATDLDPGAMRLQFSLHQRVLKGALDQDALSKRLQFDIDGLTAETEHQVHRHPAEKDQREAELQTHLKDLTELMDFLTAHLLQPVRLDAGNSDASGWLFFDTRSKWIGAWKGKEDFVLRIPWQKETIEFPFTLPPSPGDLILRQRQ